MNKILLMKFKTLVTLLSAFVFGALCSSCAVLEPEEKPIRPTSENSDIAHGSSSPSGDGNGLGALNNDFR